MPRAPDLLRRFLPAGAPGAAGVAGVPTDRVADVTAELAPVFARLAATEARCDEILEQGHRDAVQAALRAADQERTIAATAQERAAAERVDALAQARQTTQEQNEAELAGAHAQAAQLRADAAERIPDHVARVTAAVAAMVAVVRPDEAS